jgi:hypothetical protein
VFNLTEEKPAFSNGRKAPCVEAEEKCHVTKLTEEKPRMLKRKKKSFVET